MRQSTVIHTTLSQPFPPPEIRGENHAIEWARASTRTASAISSQEALMDWVRRPLRSLIPHQSTLLGFGTIHYRGYSVDRVLCVDLPAGFAADLKQSSGEMHCPALAKWVETREPQIFRRHDCRAQHDSPCESMWYRSLQRYSIENGIVDGMVDYVNGRMTFALLLNFATPPEQFKALIRGVCTSRVCDAWRRIGDAEFGARQSKPVVRVTHAERQVLELLTLGKTNWEIGQILGKSELTIKTQLKRLFVKTRTSNRTQLSTLRL